MQNIGISTDFINKMVNKHFFGRRAVKSIEDYDSFLRLISPARKKHVVYMHVNNVFEQIGEALLEAFGIRIIDEMPEEIKKSKLINGFENTPSDCVLVVIDDISAADEYTALRHTIQKISLVFDIFGIFHHKAISQIGAKALVKRNSEANKPVLLSTTINEMHFISDQKPDAAAQEMQNFIIDIRLPLGSDHQKFQRVVDFHGMALRSTAPENQLLNLWTALETIVPNTAKLNAVDGVVDGAIPFIGLNYVYRLASSLKYDLWRWNRGVASTIIENIDFPEDFDTIDKIFSLAVCKELREQRTELFEKLANFELLRYRIFSLGDAFENSRKGKARIELHQKMVEWQLFRIYRTRNSIVHSSQAPRFTPSLVVSAHDYFDQIFKITAELSSGLAGFQTFDEVFLYSKDAYFEYLAGFSEFDEADIKHSKRLLWRPKKILRKSEFFKGFDPS